MKSAPNNNVLHLQFGFVYCHYFIKLTVNTLINMTAIINTHFYRSALLRSKPTTRRVLLYPGRNVIVVLHFILAFLDFFLFKGYSNKNE